VDQLPPTDKIKSGRWYTIQCKLDHLGHSTKVDGWTLALRSICVFHDKHIQTSLSNRRVAAAVPLHEKRPEHGPDMQKPLWSLDQPIVSYGLRYQVWILLMAVVALTLNVVVIRCEGHAFDYLDIMVIAFCAAIPTMAPLLAHASSWAINTDAYELYFSICRLLVLSLRESDSVYQHLYAVLWVADALCCTFLSRKPLEYCVPITKEILSAALSAPFASLEVGLFSAYPFIALEVLACAPKLGWLVCTFQRVSWLKIIHNFTWTLLWTAFWAAMGFFSFFIYHSSPVVVEEISDGCINYSRSGYFWIFILACSGYIFFLQKLRDLSDSFQVFWITNKYE